MTKYWIGAGRRASPQDFSRAAEALGCPVDTLRAVWQVEAAGHPFRADGSLERRFEPHKLAKPEGTWKTSRALSASQRERKFEVAFTRNPEDAMRATSWGAPQIMGFNASPAGFGSAGEMVEAMADDEAAQLQGFVALVLAWKLDGALRARDWKTFAARYNGDANVAAYAAQLEAAWQALTGKASPVVLRSGDKGAAVRRLQQALGMPPDGSFGPDTVKAVLAFQTAAGLPVDGVVGARTWEALEKRRDAEPIRQPATDDRIAKVGQVVSIVGTGAGAVAGVVQVLPESSLNLLIVCGAVFAVAALAFWAFRKTRGVA